MISKIRKQKFYADMGFRLKQVRQLRRVSQHELGIVLGVVTQTIQKYESGEIKMTPETIKQCAEVFKIPVGYFYGEDADQRQFSRASLLIASEVMTLPNDDLRKSVYTLIKSINKTVEQDNTP